MTGTRRPGRFHAVPLVAAVLGALLAVPAAAGCARVRSRGAWTVTDAAPYADVVLPNGTNADAGPAQHILGLPFESLAFGGPPTRLAASDGVRILRTTDAGCTWRRVYSIAPSDATGIAADPVLAAVQPDVEYSIRAFAGRLAAPATRPVAGKDPMYAVVSNSDGWFTGIGLNVVGQPYYIARSLDGGATWQTSLLTAKLDGATVATPVLGSGTGVAIATSPADPKTAFLLVDTRDPRRVEAKAPPFYALYVTRDMGTTWSYGAPLDESANLVADPGDPNTVYLTGTKVIAVTLGATPKRTEVVGAPPGHYVVSFDVVRPAHRPASMLLTTAYRDSLLGVDHTALFRSADGGRTWTRIPFQGATGLGWFGGIAAGAWFTASGDILLMRSSGGNGASTVLSYRWDARRRAWRRPVVEHPPLGTGYSSVNVVGFAPLDTAHRYFVTTGTQIGSGNAHADVIGVYDSGGR